MEMDLKVELLPHEIDMFSQVVLFNSKRQKCDL